MKWGGFHVPWLSKDFFTHPPSVSALCLWRSTFMSFYVFSKPCSTLHNTSWHRTHSLMLYSYCCQNSDISSSVQQICFYVLWFHIHLIALYTVIRATGLLFLQCICSSRHNHFCLVIFLFFTSQTSPMLKLFIINKKTEYSNRFPNMALDVLLACHTFQTRFYHQAS